MHRWRRVQSVSKVPINLGFKSSNGSCMREREGRKESKYELTFSFLATVPFEGSPISKESSFHSVKFAPRHFVPRDHRYFI